MYSSINSGHKKPQMDSLETQRNRDIRHDMARMDHLFGSSEYRLSKCTPEPTQGSKELSKKGSCFLQADTSISHDKRAPDTTFSFVESSDSQLDNRSMTQTLDASPVKPDISDDLHVASGTREIPSVDQSSTGVRQAGTLLIASCDVATQADQSHFDNDPLILTESSKDLTNLFNFKNSPMCFPSDLRMIRSRTWDMLSTSCMDLESMELSLFPFPIRVKSFFGGWRPYISSQNGEAVKFLPKWRGLFSPPIFSLPSVNLSFKVPAPKFSSIISSSVGKDSGSLETVLSLASCSSSVVWVPNRQ